MFEEKLMEYISESMLDLGLSPKLKGFVYVKEAIFMYLISQGADYNLKDAVHIIAEKYSLVDNNVNKAMRILLENAWDSNTLNASHDLFKWPYINTLFPPSCFELIAALSETIKITLGESGNMLYYMLNS